MERYTLCLKTVEPVEKLSSYQTKDNFYIISTNDISDWSNEVTIFIIINGIYINKNNIVWYEFIDSNQQELREYKEFLWYSILYENRIIDRITDYIPVYNAKSNRDVQLSAKVDSIIFNEEPVIILTGSEGDILIELPEAIFLSDEQWSDYLEEERNNL